MPTPRKPVIDECEPLVPHFTYRTSLPIVLKTLCMGPTRLREEIKKGRIAVIDVTGNGRVFALTGQQLIDHQRRRVAEAEAAAAERRAKATA
jgi:hypothetical protein